MVSQQNSEPFVSIVIRSRDEAKSIGRVIEGIRAQSSPLPREIVVVDSGSEDGTRELAESLGARVFVIPSERFTYGYALNHGVERSRGNIICCLSAHCPPLHNDWLQELIGPIVDGRADATFGRQVASPGVNPFEEVSLSKHFPPNCPSTGRVAFSNANSAFGRIMWEAQPFDEHLPCWEDYLWYELLRNRFTFEYRPNASVYHAHTFSLQATVRRAYNDGRSFLMLKERYEVDVIKKEAEAGGGMARVFLRDVRRHLQQFWNRGQYAYFVLAPLVRILVFGAYWLGSRQRASQ